MNINTLKLLAMITSLTVIAPSLVAMEQELSRTPAKLSLGKRPENIQRAVDNAFIKLQKFTPSWGYAGEYGFYYLMNFNDAQIIRDIVSQSDSKDIYLIDVGAGAGGWGRATIDLLQKEFGNSDKHFHVMSISGSNELSDNIRRNGNITHHEFGRFKIENIETELKDRGFDLTGKVNLIVSRWTLRHLVDPMGTLKQLYNLLISKNGLILSTGFLFKLSNVEEPISTLEGWKVLSCTAPSLFYKRAFMCDDESDFILIKQDESPLEISLKYTGNVTPAFDSFCESKRVCEFKTTQNLQDCPSFIHDNYFGNDASKKLYTKALMQYWIHQDKLEGNS